MVLKNQLSARISEVLELEDLTLRINVRGLSANTLQMEASASIATPTVIDAFCMRISFVGSHKCVIGEPGIAVAVVAQGGASCMVAFQDMRELNQGANSTDGSRIVMQEVNKRLGRVAPGLLEMPVQWVELDSFDRVDEVIFDTAGQLAWRPLKGSTEAERGQVEALRSTRNGMLAYDVLLKLVNRYRRR